MTGSVTYEGVTFVVAPCARMTRAEFIRAHLDIFWKDRDARTRRKMLAEVYNLIVPSSASEEEE